MRRLRGAVFVVVLLGAGGALLGAGPGYPTERPRLLAGTAWLPSSAVGQLTLLDGSSVEVAAQVRVAPPGDRLDAVQDGSSAYAVDQTAGTVRRVDGATFDQTDPASPVPGARDGLQVFAGPGALYTVDTRRGVLVATDPRSLKPRSGPLPLAGQVDPQSVAVDGAGRLWLLDASTGDLVWVSGGQRHVRPRATSPGAGRLTVAGGDPVLVDTAGRTAQVLDPDSGTARHTVPLDLRPGDQIQVGGAPHDPRLYLVAARGVLTICELTETACANAVPLPVGGGRPGAPVEAGGRVFVPDDANGRVWLVDLHELRVVAQPQVLSPPAPFQLLNRDGVVFFNDPASERAGVIRLDGGVRTAAKYDPRDPGHGVTGAGAPDAAAPVPGHSPTPPVAATPPAPTLLAPAPPDPPAAAAPAPAAPAPAGLPQLSIAVNPLTPQVGQLVPLSVTSSGPPAPRTAHWFFGDGQQADGLRPTHAWQSARRFLVSVQATFPDGRTATASVEIDVTAAAPSPTPSPVPSPTPPAQVTLTITISGGAGKGHVTGTGLGGPCSSTCTVQVPRGQVVNLREQIDAPPVKFDSWSGACRGSGQDCQVRMDANTSVTATFFEEVIVSIQLTDSLNQPVPAGCCAVDVSGGTTFRCTDGCTLTVKPGTVLTFTAVSRQPAWQPLNEWGGDCAGQGTTCRLTVTGTTGVSKSFAQTG